MLKRNHSTKGQGLTEYINIVALVAVTSVAVFSAYGGVTRSQVAAVANEIAGNGQGSADALSAAQGHSQAANFSATSPRGMADYSAYGNDNPNAGTSTANGTGSGNSSSGGASSSTSNANGSGSGHFSSGSATAGISNANGSGSGHSSTAGTSSSASTDSSSSVSNGSGNNTENSELADIPPPPEQPSAILSQPVGATPPQLAAPIEETALLTTGLGENIDKLISKSATLTRDVKALLESPDWTIEYGVKSQLDRANKLITIEREGTSTVVQSLAHEVGHALYTPAPNVDFMGLTRDEFVTQSVKIQTDDEGAATFYNLEIRAEIIAKTEVKNAQGRIETAGTDIEVAGVKQENYKNIYKKYLAGEFTKKETTEAMGRIFGNHENATTTKTYYQYHQEGYLKYFNEVVIVNSAGRAHGYWYEKNGEKKAYIKR